jgi:putative hydrolase of the HAD superfamily
MLPKGILFDLDDTLVVFRAVGEPVWQGICREYAPQLGVTPEFLREGIRKASTWYWSDKERHRIGRQDQTAAYREVLGRAFGDMGLEQGDLAQSIADAYFAQRHEAIYLFDDAIDTLKHLRSRGVALALVTNGQASLQRGKIERFELEPYFDAIFIEGELGYGKPDPRVFQHALDALDLVAADAWCVGDNLEWDIGGAQALGIHAIWHDVEGNGLPGGATVVPDRIILRVGELLTG